MSTLDFVIISTYLFLIFLLAYFSGKKNHDNTNAESQYLSDRDLTLPESLFSIIATEVSALTFLGIPAFAFNKNFSFVQIYFGALIGRIIIALFFVPKIYGKGLTVYQIMTIEESNPTGRKSVALFYATSKIFSVGVRLFSGSILVAQFFGISTPMALISIALLTFVYTLIGGLKAVVRTDMLQMILFVVGGVVAHKMIPEIANQSWSEMIGLAHQNSKTVIFNFDSPLSIVAGILGGMLFDISTHGVDQDFAQRTMATKSLRTGQMAIFLSSFFSIAVGLLFLAIGSLLWSYYQIHPFPQSVPNPDHLFAYFIVEYFPSGLKGLMVAGVMASTMSTLDSTINALCATVYNDILPKRKRNNLKLYFFIDNIIITALLLIIALIASQNDGLLLLGLRVQSWTAGSLLALFVTKIFLKKSIPIELNSTNVFGTYIFGLSGVAFNTFIIQGDWNWNVYFGTIFSLVFLKSYTLTMKK